jgi:hypothetical protein
VITDTQTAIQRPSGLRRPPEVARPLVVRLLTDHVVAKMVALLFAGVLVLLIDREITQTVVDAQFFEVRIGDLPRGAPAQGQRVIILEKEPGVAIRSFTNPVKVTIKGQQKLLDHMRTWGLVGRVSVKKDWLKKEKDTPVPTTQAIEGNSVNFGVPATVTFDKPIQVEIDAEVPMELPLAAAPKDVAPGFVAEVSFQPATVKVLGPSFYLGGAGSILSITVPIPTGGRTSDYSVPITALPDDVVQKQIRMAPGQQVTAAVKFSNRGEQPLDVKDVPIKWVFTPKHSEEYKFAPIGLARETVTVTVRGTPEALAPWIAKPEELKKAIRVEIDVGRIVDKVAPTLPQSGAHGDESGEVEVIRIPDNLKLVGVAPAQVDVTITKR